MKIAFTTSGITLKDSLDPRFGRAPKFLIYDLENNVFDIIDNQKNLNAAQGAGIQSAETIVKAGVNALVTGHCGPKAFRVLSTAGITIYNTDATTIDLALDQFRSGKLNQVTSANAEGH